MRKIFSTVAAAALMLVAPTARAADVCGDVNRSGSVTTSDALLVLKDAVGQMVALQCPPVGQPLRTGQTSCFNAAGTSIACASTGQDGEFQKGIAHAFVDNGDGTISDGVTGLMWEKLDDNNAGGIHDWDTTYSWTTAVTTKIAALNSANFAGHGDWRLPNRNELFTLSNAGAVNPAAFSVFAAACAPGCTAATCSCTQAHSYWTSSTFQYNGADAWFVSFLAGSATGDAKTAPLYVRAVRGGS